MNEPKHPSHIAREAFKLLAIKQMPPTPANYQTCYNEIAGLPNPPVFPEVPLRHLAAALTPENGPQEEAKERLSVAISRRNWPGVSEAVVAFVRGGNIGPKVTSGLPESSVLPLEFSGKLARLIECVLPALGDENERVLVIAGDLVAKLRQPGVAVQEIQGELATLAHQALFAAEEQVEIKGALLKLMHLIIENIGELSVDDSWLKGQIDGLLASVEPPLTLRHLDDMERRLRDVMDKQRAAKVRSVEAQAEMRQMLAEFIERLAKMNATSSEFEGQIEESAQKIERIERLEDLRPLLDEVIRATRGMAEETARSRESLQHLQDKVVATEAELIQLHHELDSASALARHDPLTDALNRKGLEEALAREIASMRRKDSPLSISLLDIDNFKKLNDCLGHEAGDGALVHLANVTRSNLRPGDTLARYGGEEFVVLMPDTLLEQGIEVMVRLQRELTKAIFLSGSERVLITFSAGVAQLAPDESGADSIRRADQAMYLAKRAGKNRVMGS